MMQKMCGGDGAEGGEIADALAAESNIQKYLPFFAYFKTLSKMCHLAMTVRKEISQKKKIANADSKLEQSAAIADMNRKLVESLDFYSAI